MFPTLPEDLLFADTDVTNLISKSYHEHHQLPTRRHHHHGVSTSPQDAAANVDTAIEPTGFPDGGHFAL